MIEAFGEFRFLRPGWLLAIPPTVLLCLAARQRFAGAGWQRRVGAVQRAALGVGGATTNAAIGWPAITAFVVACLALAGPSWRSAPEASARGQHAMVVLFDLSPSMLARDVKPDRLTRARLKLLDLLERRDDGETALVVYAGDAHRVTPLTDDPTVIATLVPTLHPDIVPLAGSRPEAALEIALATFAGAARDRGDIVLVTDGMHPEAIAAFDERLPRGYRLSILGVGSADGAPVPDPEGGGFLRDASGEAVLARLDGAALAALAARHDGRYGTLTVDDRDVRALAALGSRPLGARVRPDEPRFDRREDAGYWLVLALLPLAALGFRRGLLWCALPFALLGAPEAHALDWSALWLNADQRAARALARGDAAAAAEDFADRRWRAVAHYRAGEPERAAELLADAASAADRYNLGNALALAGRLEAALDAYDRALALLDDRVGAGDGALDGDETREAGDAARLAEDARHNRAEVQAVLDAERAAQEPEPDEEEKTESEEAREGAEGSDGEESAPQAPAAGEASAATQREVGGSAGSGQSLAQDALADGGPSASAPGAREDDPAAARDATAVGESGAARGDEAPSGAEREADTMSATAEANDNAVLNPYSERWLRTLPQDPRGYLRRKFAYQAQLRALERERDAADTGDTPGGGTIGTEETRY